MNTLHDILGMFPVLLPLASPLLFATLGALTSEYAGVLAVFTDGTINLSAFIFIAVTILTNSPLLAFLAAVSASLLFVLPVAVFTVRTGANPFLTGLSLNLFSPAITSLFSAVFFKTRGVIPLAAHITVPLDIRNLAFPAGSVLALVLYFFLHRTQTGLRLRASGSAPEVLVSRGVNPHRYAILSWGIAAVCAACAGILLAVSVHAWVPNISAGRGWTALAAVFLGYRNPLLCVPAVLLFALAEYSTTILQGSGFLPGSIILGLPQALALLVFIVVKPLRKKL